MEGGLGFWAVAAQVRGLETGGAVTEEMLSRILQESVTGAFLEVIHMMGFTRIYRVNNEWEFLEL